MKETQLTAQQLFEKGMLAYDQEHFNYLTMATVKDPNHHEAWHALSRRILIELHLKPFSETDKQQYHNALLCVKNALTLSPDNPVYLMTKGDVLRLQASKSTSCYWKIKGEELFERSRTCYRKALDKLTNEDDVLKKTALTKISSTFEDQANFHFEKQHYQRAKELYQHLLKIHPKHPLATTQLEKIEKKKFNLSFYSGAPTIAMDTHSKETNSVNRA
jgi:tetratricopeptide (TPR) repeat protein